MPTRWLRRYFPGLSKAVTRRIYDHVISFGEGTDIAFMNYGYLGPDGRGDGRGDGDGDGDGRGDGDGDGDGAGGRQGGSRRALRADLDLLRARLYQHVCSPIEWGGLDALEVSCGLGGGTHYIKTRFRPRSVTGVDLSGEAIRSCRRRLSGDGVFFEVGDAEELRFPDASFDVVVNVESSFYYPRPERFFGHVARVLRPDGHFLYADMRYTEEVHAWRAQLRSAGLEVLRERDITGDVGRALDAQHDLVAGLIERHVPRPFRGRFGVFAGQTGGGLARGTPRAGERVYRSFVCRKRGGRTHRSGGGQPGGGGHA